MSRFDDFDEDDPLAGLLSDEDGPPPPTSRKGSVSREPIKNQNNNIAYFESKKEPAKSQQDPMHHSLTDEDAKDRHSRGAKAPSSSFMDSLFGRSSDKPQPSKGLFDAPADPLKQVPKSSADNERRTNLDPPAIKTSEVKRPRRGGGGPTLLQPKSVDDIFNNFEKTKKKAEPGEPESMRRSLEQHKLPSEHQALLSDQMHNFKNMEQSEAESFKKDFEEQRIKLEARNLEYKTALQQQKNLCEDQIRILSERQANSLRNQQEQFSVLMKQLTSQTESEMRMKSELMRNQIQLLGDFQMDQNPLLSSNSAGPTSFLVGNKTNADSSNLIEVATKETIAQLKSIHEDNMQELNERISGLLDRIRVLQEIHREELERERDKRFQQLQELEEEHKSKTEALKSRYESIISSLKDIEKNNDFTRALESLVGQVVDNTEGLGSLFSKVEGGVKMQSDVREALLKSREKQIEDLREKLKQVTEESSTRINSLNTDLQNLQEGLRNKELELDKKSYSLETERRTLDSERKFFEIEREHLLTKAKRDKELAEEFYEDQKRQENKLRKKFEKELRALRAERSKMLFSKKLKRQGSMHFTEFVENLSENVDPDVFGMFHALKEKEEEYVNKLSHILKKEKEMNSDEELIQKEKDLIIQSIEKLDVAEKELNDKLNVLQKLLESSADMRDECLELLEETSYKENNIFYLCQEIENKIIRNKKKQKSLEIQAKNIRKEREKLRSREDRFVCKLCRSQESGISRQVFVSSDLGVRTDADGHNPIRGSSQMDIQREKEEGHKSSKFLEKENMFLRSVSMTSLI